MQIQANDTPETLLQNTALISTLKESLSATLTKQLNVSGEKLIKKDDIEILGFAITDAAAAARRLLSSKTTKKVSVEYKVTIPAELEDDESLYTGLKQMIGKDGAGSAAFATELKTKTVALIQADATLSTRY